VSFNGIFSDLQRKDIQHSTYIFGAIFYPSYSQYLFVEHYYSIIKQKRLFMWNLSDNMKNVSQHFTVLCGISAVLTSFIIVVPNPVCDIFTVHGRIE